MSQQKRPHSNNDEKTDADREQKRQKLDDIGKELSGGDIDYNMIEQELIKNLQEKLKLEYESTLTTNAQRVFNEPDILWSVSAFLPFGQRTQFMYLSNRVHHLLNYETTKKSDEQFDLDSTKLSVHGEGEHVLGVFDNLPLEYAQNVVRYSVRPFSYRPDPEYKLTEEDERVKDEAITNSRLQIPIPQPTDPDRVRPAELLDFNHPNRRTDPSYPNPEWFMDEEEVKNWPVEKGILGSWESGLQPSNVIESMEELETLDVDLEQEDATFSRTVQFGRAQTISEVEQQNNQRSYYYKERDISRLKLDYNPIVVVAKKPLEIKRMVSMVQIAKLMQYTKDLTYTTLRLENITSPGYILEWEFDLPPSVNQLTVSLDRAIFKDYDSSARIARPKDPWKLHELPYPELLQELPWRQYPRYETVVLPLQKTNNIWANITTLCLYGGRVPSSLPGYSEAWKYLLSNVPKLKNLEVTDNGRSSRLVTIINLNRLLPIFKSLKSVSFKARDTNLFNSSELFTYTRSMKIILNRNDDHMPPFVIMPYLKYLTIVQTRVGSPYDGDLNELVNTLIHVSAERIPRLKFIRFAIVYQEIHPTLIRRAILQTIQPSRNVRPSVRIFGFETDVAEVHLFGKSSEFEPDGDEQDDTDDHKLNAGLTFEHPLWKAYIPDLSEDDLDDDEETGIDTRIINTTRGPAPEVNDDDEEEEEENGRDGDDEDDMED